MQLEKRPFEGKIVYYSGSIKGVPEPDTEFPWKLVQYMVAGGANVLSEHVAARNPQEMLSVRRKRMGSRAIEFEDNPEPWFLIRKTDTEWVDQATHVVALVNSPSHGVGMEIERALLKPDRDLAFTPILCLVRADLLDKLTFMIRGIKEKGFFLKTYTDLESAQTHIKCFLTENSNGKN